MRATRSFTTTYDGERVEIIAGRTHVTRDHELVRRFPDAFDDSDVQIAASDRAIEEFGARYPAVAQAASLSNGNGNGSRSLTPGGQRIAAEQEAIRREWLAELDRRDRAKPSKPTSEDSFWSSVERQLADPRRERELEESCRELDWLENLEHGRLEREREDVAGWLDES